MWTYAATSPSTLNTLTGELATSWVSTSLPSFKKCCRVHTKIVTQWCFFLSFFISIHKVYDCSYTTDVRRRMSLYSHILLASSLFTTPQHRNSKIKRYITYKCAIKDNYNLNGLPIGWPNATASPTITQMKPLKNILRISKMFKWRVFSHNIFRPDNDALKCPRLLFFVFLIESRLHVNRNLLCPRI